MLTVFNDQRYINDYLNLVYNVYTRQIPSVFCNYYKVDKEKSTLSHLKTNFSNPPKEENMIKYQQILLLNIYNAQVNTMRTQTGELGIPWWSLDEFEAIFASTFRPSIGDLILINDSIQILLSQKCSIVFQVHQLEQLYQSIDTKRYRELWKVILKVNPEISDEAELQSFITDRYVYVNEFDALMSISDYILYHDCIKSVNSGEFIKRHNEHYKNNYIICKDLVTNQILSIINVDLFISYLTSKLLSIGGKDNKDGDILVDGLVKALPHNICFMTLKPRRQLDSSFQLTLSNVEMDAFSLQRKYPWATNVRQFQLIDHVSNEDFNSTIINSLVGPEVQEFYEYCKSVSRSNHNYSEERVLSFLNTFQRIKNDINPIQVIMYLLCFNHLFNTRIHKRLE